jgi:hypothetical protein
MYTEALTNDALHLKTLENPLAKLQKIIEVDAFQFTLFNSELHMRANPWMDAREAQEDQQEKALELEINGISLRKVTLLLAGDEYNNKKLETAKLFISVYGSSLGDGSGHAPDDFEMVPGEWLVSDAFSPSGLSVVSNEDVENGNF